MEGFSGASSEMSRLFASHMQEIALKQTRVCPNRGSAEFMPIIFGTYGIERYGCQQLLTVSTNESWKSVRAALQPMFTASGLLNFLPQLIGNCSDTARSLL